MGISFISFQPISALFGRMLYEKKLASVLELLIYSLFVIVMFVQKWYISVDNGCYYPSDFFVNNSLFEFK